MRRDITMTASLRSAFGSKEDVGYCPPRVTIHFHDADVCSWDRGAPLSSVSFCITEEQIAELFEAHDKARGPITEEDLQTGFGFRIVTRPCIKRGN